LEVNTTEDEVSEEEEERELDIPNCQISMVNPEWQKLMEELETKKSAIKGKK